jgi:hypothetical protein
MIGLRADSMGFASELARELDDTLHAVVGKLGCPGQCLCIIRHLGSLVRGRPDRVGDRESSTLTGFGISPCLRQ